MSVIPVETTWGFIEPGALVAGADGGAWRVTDRRIKLPLIAFAIWDGKDQALWVTKTYDEEVTLLDESTGRAVELIQSILGAESPVVLDPMPRGPDTKAVRAKYMAHLKHHHDQYVTATVPLVDMIQLHALEHASATLRGIAHIHRRSF